MWMMPLHLHVNQKSDYDDYDDDDLVYMNIFCQTKVTESENVVCLSHLLHIFVNIID